MQVHTKSIFGKITQKSILSKFPNWSRWFFSFLRIGFPPFSVMRDTPPRFEVQSSRRSPRLRMNLAVYVSLFDDWPYMYHFSTSQNKDRPCGSVSRRTRRKPRGTRVESGGAPPRCGRKNATREAHIGCCRVPSCATGRTAERGHAIAFRAVAGCVACCRLAFGAHLAGNSCWPLCSVINCT